MLRRKAILQYERPVKDQQNCWKWGEGRGEVGKDAISGMEFVMMDVRLSVPLCDESTARICFQLYARMMCKASSLESVRKFWLDMEDWDPGPCLYPVNECLNLTGRNILWRCFRFLTST